MGVRVGGGEVRDTDLDSSTAWETRGSSRSGGALGDRRDTSYILIHIYCIYVYM